MGEAFDRLNWQHSGEFDQNISKKSNAPGFAWGGGGMGGFGIDRYIIGHVRYINIQAWLRGFRVKIANFSSFFCLSIPTGDLDTKKTTPNIDVRPESLGPMLEY